MLLPFVSLSFPLSCCIALLLGYAQYYTTVVLVLAFSSSLAASSKGYFGLFLRASSRCHVMTSSFCFCLARRIEK